MMKNKKRNFLLIWILALALLLNVLAFVPVVAEGDDPLTGCLDGLKVLIFEGTVVTDDDDDVELGYSITQGDNSINQGSEITTDNINIKFTFRVPMAHENIDGYDGNGFTGGECVYFELSNGFEVSGDTADLKLGDVKIGTISYLNVGGVSYAKIQFADKDTGVFAIDTMNGEYYNVWASFEATLKYDGDGLGGSEDTRSVKILEKDVTVKGLQANYEYSVVKTGTLNTNEQTIDWTVTITATKDGEDISLEGYTFSDDLTDVGQYVAGTFKVGNQTQTPFYGENNVLSYNFPAGTKSPVTVKFSTKIDEDSFDDDYKISGTNTAQLKKDGEVKGEGEYDFHFEPTWIVKSEGTANNGTINDNGMYNPADTTITWKITANHLGASLENVVIKDYLPKGLVLESASYKLLENGTWIEKDNLTWEELTENGDRYYAFNFPTLDEKIELTITAKVTVTDTKPAWEEVTYTNSASIEWGTEGNGGWSSDLTPGVGVTIGVDSIIKSGTRLKDLNNLDDIDKKIVDAGVEWEVKINALEVEYEHLVAYDLIVHGAPDFTWDSSTMTIVDPSPGNEDTIDDINTEVLSALKPRYNQRYIEGSFDPKISNDFEWAVYQVKQDDKVIADLLVVKLNKVDGANEGSKQYKETSFTFRTLVLDPTIYAGNESKYVSNTASLFGNNSLKKHADAWVEFESKILEKKMLERGTEGFDKTAKATEGFDYVNKTAIFRILVNKDGLKLSDMEINGDGTVGPVTLHDTLPVGWEFVDYDTGDSVNTVNDTFKIHLYEADTDGNIIANDNLEATATVKIAGNPETSAVAEYTFDSLDQPYVVLIKAKLTDEQYEKELIKNKPTTKFTNKAQLFYGDNLNLTTEEKQDITVNSQILDKKGTLDEGGFITWTVDYNPYGIEVSDPVFIVDQLPPTISPPIGSNGKLLVDEDGTTYISITSFELKEDGKRPETGSTIDVIVGTVDYDEEGKVIGVKGESNVAYDPVTGFLVFDIKDATVAYRFTYTTEITGGKAGDKIKNTVSLYGVEGEKITSDKEFSVSDSHVNAGFMRAGRIVIKKTDAKGVSIDAPATFTLYTADGSTVRWQGETVGGSVAIGGLRPGNYILEETTAPEDYTASDIKYYIEISKSGDSFSYKFYTFTEDVNDKVEIADPAFGNQLSVVNYQAGTANLIVSKELGGDGFGYPDKEFTFKFTLTGDSAAAGTSYTYFRSDSPTVGVEIASGGTFTLKPGESIMIVGLPDGATYTITEIEENEGDNAGYTAEDEYLSEAITVDDGKTGEYTANFINTYSAEGSWSPEATKDFSGGTLTLKNREFTFKLEPVGNAPMPEDSDGEVVDTVHNESDGTIVFPEITFTHEDLDWEAGDGEPAHAEFKYKISEVRPDDPEEGMEYDATVYTVTVKVVDDRQGNLTVTATYEAEEGTNKELNENGTPIFTNIYEASGEWSPKVTKKLYGRGLRNNEFEFKMTQVAGKEVTPPVDITWPLTAKNNASGVVAFGPITFNENHIGKTFEFIIREVTPSPSEGGMRYDENQYKVIVKVKDAGNGNLEFEEEYYLYEAEQAPGEVPEALNGITFINRYSAGNAWTPNVTKELVGRELKDKEFEFVLKGPQGNVIEKVKNDADGNVVFSSIGFSEADIGGSYTYTIQEVVGSEPGMSYDTRSIKIKVSISDAGGGVLNINASYPAVTTFVNRYSGPSGITVTANKVWKDLPSGWTEHLPTIWFKLYRSVEGGTAEVVPGLALQKLPAGVTQVSWNGLEKYDPDGKLYVYSVKEVDENGKDYEPKYFEKTEKGLTVTNAFNKELVEGDEDFETEIDVTGHKAWKGVPKGQTVPTIWLKLYRHIEGGTPVAVPGRPIMELRPGVTQGTWKDLEKVDEDYNYYIYTVKEVDSKGNDYEPPHFRKTEEGLTVTNTHTAGAPVTGETLSVYTIMGAMLMALAALFLILTRRKRAKAK